MDVCAYLGRDDGKWYLGGGERLLFAPPHPEHVDALGFWDDAHYYDLAVRHPFTVTLLDERDRPHRLQRTDHHWQPDRLAQTFETGAGLRITERKAVSPSDTLLSAMVLEHSESEPMMVRVVVWTHRSLDPTASPLQEVSVEDDRLRYRQALCTENRPAHSIDAELAVHPRPESASVSPSESAPRSPQWIYTPFRETLNDRALGPRYEDELPDAGHCYLGLLSSVTIPPGETRRVTAGLKISPADRDTGSVLADTLAEDTPLQHTANEWTNHFDRVPSLTCSDDHLQMAYWYRWYGLHLLSRSRPEGNFQHPAVYEGPEYFRKHITYSAQCHMREVRWLPTPKFARGSLLNFIETQRDDGGFYGHVFPHHVHEESFYHTNWAQTWGVHRLHPDRSFLTRAYEGLSKYAAYFDRERDPEDVGLYDIFNHYETGQEYMRRYTSVEPDADEVHWGHIFRLKGVDAAVQIYQTKQALAKMAATLDRPSEADRWRREAERTGNAILKVMWDPDDELFYDVDPDARVRTNVKAAVCFYPYLTDLVGDEHLAGLKRHLFNRHSFWTPYPVPATSRDDPSFSATPHWKGQRKNCPWNGRVWPMTNSHIADALGTTAVRFDDEQLRQRTAEFITRFVGMLFFDGDPDRPNCFEHYNPLTGQAARYRGIDDYQHSWLVDLLIRYLAGIRPADDHVVVDPFPFDVEQISVDGVPIRGHRIGMSRTGTTVDVRVDGEHQVSSTLDEPIRLDI